MKKLLLGLVLVATAAGCKSNPYCLNCKDSGNGVITPDDMTSTGSDAGDAGGQLGPDMVGSGGPCAPTAGGIEICDGLDNDCNGHIDDVDPSKLQMDPKNCGMCGNECKYAHAGGKCVPSTTGGMPMCQLDKCQPGYIDLDGDPTNGCEYVCTQTNNGIEICDGKDNNCDGTVDEGFTTSWFDAAKQMPKYDKLLNDCGQCGTVCSLGVGTVMACQPTGANGRGQCAVVACFNGNDAMGNHQTYRHDPTAGNINVTGCEYHCPKPASTTGNDCNPNGACTFPVETCNGSDDDCNFHPDDNLTDPGLGQPCADGAPGKLCSGTQCNCNGHPGAKCVCAPGTLMCAGGGLSCSGSAGPSPEICDPVTATNPTGAPLDNDCNGKVDDPFTATWQDAGNQIPRYDSDPNHCGQCVGAVACALPHGPNICRLFAGDTKGSCAIAACDPGWAWVPKTNTTPVTYPAAGTCTVDHTATPRDSTQAQTGVGCFYQCGQANNTPETCDGVDNDCDGCIDNGLTAPPICSTKGECALTTNTVACSGTNGVPSSVGWKCTYGAGIDVDGMGNLSATETKCDAEDNNCNGACDENFPDVPIVSTAPDGTACNNPRTAKGCSGGQGACQLNGTFACKMDKSAEQCQTAGGVAIGPTGDPSKAADEKCNGKDDDCNGLVDEPTDSGTFKGWHDPMVKLTVGVDPFTSQAAHTVWVYAYEAAKPDASATSPGSLSTRACANAGVLPWSNVTLAQAQAACTAIKNKAGTSIGRLCSAWEWQETCNGNIAPATDWSMSAGVASYQNLVCNDAVQEQQCKFGAATTGCQINGNCTSNNQCSCANAVDCTAGFTCSAAKVCVVALNAQRCATGATPEQCKNTTCNASGQCPCANDSDCSPGFVCNAGAPKVCVGSGAWPTGSQGAAGAANQCSVDFTAANGGAAHDLSGNLQEWTSTPVTVASGLTATIAAGADGSHWVINGMTGMLASYVGAQLVISNATAAGNNGTFMISAVNSTTSVTVVNPTGAVQAAPATVHWSLIYNKLRGGNYASTGPVGVSCEFDFDIASATFANNDVGFRCCADSDPAL